MTKYKASQIDSLAECRRRVRRLRDRIMFLQDELDNCYGRGGRRGGRRGRRGYPGGFPGSGQ